MLMSEAKLPTAWRRLEVLVGTNDGFIIAEEDLRHRGPGELLGTRQHGEAGLRVARLPDDFDLLEWAREDAGGLAERDPTLTRPASAAVRSALIRQHGGSAALLDAG